MADITRRSFIAGMGALGAAAALGASIGVPDTGPAWASDVDDSMKVSAKDGEYHGYCAMCMERGGCGNVVTVKDGVVVNIEGDPNRASNAGTMCPRGKGAILNMYNPYRITAPMKRTNPEKGMDVDPQWVEITWDEALDLYAQKLKEVHDRDPRELVNFYGFAAYESSHATFGHGEWCLQFGSPNESSAKGQMCSVHYGGSYIMNSFPTVNYDGQYTKYILDFGGSFGMDKGGANGDARATAKALKDGLQIKFISPYCAREASEGEWIPSRPGTDLSIIYSIMHTMLYELDEYDKEFCKNRTNGPYLIDDAGNGDYVRNEAGKPVMVDADGSVKAFDDPTLSDPQLEGRFEYNGTVYPTGFTLFKEALKDFNADWASEKCGIPADKLRQLASELVENACIGSTITIDGEEMPYRPALAFMGRACSNHVDGTLIDIYSRVLNLLLGNVGFPGGIFASNSPNYVANADGVVKPSNEATFPKEFHWPPSSMELKDFMPHRHSCNSIMMQVMNDPEKWGFDYKPTLVVSQGSNPIMCNTEPDIAISALKKVDYIIYQSCYHMDEMALLSDLLLPEDAALECTTVYNYPGPETASRAKDETDFLMAPRGIVMKHGVGALYNTMEGNAMMIEAFDRAGLISVLNNVANAGGCIGVPKGMPLKGSPYELDPNKKYDIMDMWERTFKNKTGHGLDWFDDPKHAIWPIVTYKNEAGSYSSHRDKTTRFSIYLHDQLQVGQWLIPQIEATGRDAMDFVGVSTEELKRRYCAVPYYPDDSLRPTFNAPAEYDLRASTFKKPMFLYRMAGMDQNPVTRDWSKRYDPEFNAVLINPEDAEARGIQENDQVYIESQFGKTKGRAYVTGRVAKGCTCIGGVQGRRSPLLGMNQTEDTNWNEIATGRFGYIDPLDGAFDVTVRVKVYKA